jgi:hypothetical protein
MRQTSATFDEILLPAAGARGYVTGDFDLVRFYHPRLMPYIYGLPIALSGSAYPAEAEQWNARGGSFPYAQELFFRSGNDAELLLFRVRLLAVAFGAALVVVVFAFVRRRYGPAPGVFAAGMTAFLPDLIAHGGIAYNDVPAALAIFAAVWALDRAAAAPAHATVLVASLLTAVALSVKYSAIALAPIALLLILMEAAARGRGWKQYLAGVLRLVPLAVVSVYVVLVAVYLGDFMLTSFMEGLIFNIGHAAEGHGGVPAWLMGRFSVQGFWYFFPMAFVIKTPAALHVLLLLGAIGLLRGKPSVAALLRSPLRAPAVAAAVFGFFLLTANLNIGFRHALPVLPFLIVMAAAGLGRLWHSRGRIVRVALATLVVVQAASVLSWYPHFIPYISEYFPDRDEGYLRLTDSSHDWGQGLVLLRQFMEEENIDIVQLSYFGSADPGAYGVRYVPLRSFFDLPPTEAPDTVPRVVAISATNLVGGYVDGAFARLQDWEPYRVLGHTIFIYRVDD